MSDLEQYKGSEHPLKRIYDARLTGAFERRPCSIVCPRCKKLLFAYHWKQTFGIGFFSCDHCAWFHARPCLFDILKRFETPKETHHTGATIGAALDRITRRVLPSQHRPKPFYHNL